eukprot:8976583-Ditylum_brightwellii.AAC.1
MYNYPVGSECRRDSNSISQTTSPATYKAAGQCHGTDKQEKQVREGYATKAQKCDANFAQDSPDELSLFENALKTFLTGGPIPPVLGAFSK